MIELRGHSCEPANCRRTIASRFAPPGTKRLRPLGEYIALAGVESRKTRRFAEHYPIRFLGTVAAAIGDMKVLSPRIHGFIDYAVVALFLLAPTLFGFEGLPQTLCYVVAAVHLGLSLLTAYPLGVLKLIPFPLHGVVEAVVIPTLAALPWVLGFDQVPAARNFFLVAAALVAVVVILTNYKSADLSSTARHART